MIPKTLLLTNHAPGRKSAGGVFIKELLELYPKNSICCFHTKRAPENDDNELAWLPLEYGKAPTKYGLRHFGYKVSRYSRPIVEYYFEKVRFPRLVKKAVRFGRNQKVERVIATLDSIATIQLAKPVAESLKVPLMVIVWDPPKYNLCNKYGLDTFSCRRLLKTFENIVRFSTKCSVPSERMKRSYENKYGTKCIIMVYGSKPVKVIGHTVFQPDSEKLLVGFAGSIIAKNVWDAFVAALADNNWKIGGRDVVIRMYGASLNLTAKTPVQIEYRGWRSQREMIQSLSECDIAYLPYPFDEKKKDFVTLSFPSKMAAYMAAELPVFYHGPQVSTPAEFIDKYKVGVKCHTLNHVEIIKTLESYTGNTESYQLARKACIKTFENELSADIFRKRLSEFLDIRQDELLPVVEV